MPTTRGRRYFRPMRFLILLLPAALACSAPATDTATTTASPPTQAAPSQPQPAGFYESFAAGTKPGYETGVVQLGTGPWRFTEALLGSSEQDHARAGQQAARLRTGGRLTMLFDVPAGNKISLTTAAFGTDAPSTWELWLSRDHGRTWQRNGPAQRSNGTPYQVAAFAGFDTGSLRLEIRKTDAGKNRLNILDVGIDPTNPELFRTTPATPAAPQPGARTSAPQVLLPPAKYTRPVRKPDDEFTDQDDGNLLLGNPSGATSDPANATNYLLVRPQFASAYNAPRGIPVWTSWHVGRADLTKAAPRQDDFRADPGLPRQFYQVTPQSYAGSGFDKGHNCPSGDRTASLDDNSATFLMSNMVPQAPHNNQQTWAHLEEYTRAQVQRGQEAYVVMGSYGRGGTGKNGPATTLDQGRVSVPARIWKVVVFLPEGNDDLRRIAAGQARIVAIDTPNDDAIQPQWEQYLTSVDKIEAATGLDLLSALPAAAQAPLQKLVDSGRAR